MLVVTQPALGYRLEISSLAVVGVRLHDDISRFGMEYVLQGQRDLVEGFRTVGQCRSHVPPPKPERVGLGGSRTRLRGTRLRYGTHKLTSADRGMGRKAIKHN
jgi:hypothetical protein